MSALSRMNLLPPGAALTLLVLGACNGVHKTTRTQPSMISSAASLRDDILKHGVELAWAVKPAADNGCAPLLEDGVVVFAGGGDGYGNDVPLSVRRRENGAVVWQTRSDARCPSVSAGRISWIAAHEDPSYRSESVVIGDIATGTRLCQTGAPAGDGTVSKFTLRGATLLVSTWEGPSATEGTTRHAIYSAVNCSLRWSTETQHQGGVALATEAGIVMSDVDGGHALGLYDTVTGKRKWRVPSADDGGLLRTELDGERLLVVEGTNLSTSLRVLDVRTGADLRPSVVIAGGLGTDLFDQASERLTLSRWTRDAVVVVDAWTGAETPLLREADDQRHWFQNELVRSPLVATFARNGMVDMTAIGVMLLSGRSLVTAIDGLFTPQGRFVPTRSVTVQAAVNSHGIIEVVLTRDSVVAGPEKTHNLYLVDLDGRVVCVGGAPDTAAGWSIPFEESDHHWHNVAYSLFCTARFTELGELRAIVMTSPLLDRLDPKEMPSWKGVAISRPFNAAAATR